MTPVSPVVGALQSAREGARGQRSGRGRRAVRCRRAAVQSDPDAGWSKVIADVVEGEGYELADGVPDFTVRQPGFTNIPDDRVTPLQFFELFITTALISTMVRETNRYVAGYIASLGSLKPDSRFRRWKDCTAEEMRKYIALRINMGIVKKKNTYDYWKKKFPNMDTPSFRDTMSYGRFVLIHRFFHLCNNERQPRRGEQGFDPWYKVRNLLDPLNRCFKQYFRPYQLVSIDESMVGMRNRNIYIQYLPNKRHSRFGIKKFQLCDSKTGYVMHVELYSGRDFDIRSEEGQAITVVKHLMSSCNMYNKGYHPVTDNYYTKPSLAEDLFAQGTMLTGTVRLNSRGYPKSLGNACLQVQDSKYMKNGSGIILACAYRDKPSQGKPVLLLSTGTKPVTHRTSRRAREQNKPAMVLLYNKGMGGVDLSDKKVYHIAAERATHRYWVKVAWNLIDITLRNCHELFKLKNPDTKMDITDFVSEIVMQLVGPIVDNEEEQATADGHQLTQVPGKRERDCVVCSDRSAKIRKRSRTWCAACKMGCHLGCYENFNHKL
ncbi:piggyBac transposable element-derived protein 4-like [Watersipora subatra]|uniref:piggyBac transposable element-derived protein 4-like n=1 Tax=Watersipora subatra TaxID=2589382 RepID=UPI00355BA819